jgi:uncharacterized protein YoxC
MAGNTRQMANRFKSVISRTSLIPAHLALRETGDNMTALDSSIETLTAEHTALTQKLEQIDLQYKVERPALVKELNQLARALSALTGKPVPGANQTARKQMSEEGKAAIRAGLERARLAKKAAAGAQTPSSAQAATSAVSAPKPAPSASVAEAKKESGDKTPHRR